MAENEIVYKITVDGEEVEVKLKKVSEEAEETASKSSEKIKNVIGTAAHAVKDSVMAIGSAAVGIGKSAVDSAVSMDQAMNGFIASTGKGQEETARYQNVLEEIYKNNYGEGFDDIAMAMEQVSGKLGEMDDAALKGLTESAFVLRDTFEYDITESTDAAKAMMESFGTSGEDAMSMIAAGAQNGLKDSDEFLSSISAYSSEFSAVGLNADDMFRIFETGAETGAYSMEQIGEAVGEMSSRVMDGSDSTREGFELLGLNADEMAEKFAAGGDSARDAFQQTMEAMAGLEDPLAQNTAGVDLFGSTWEEMGAGAIEQLSGIQTGVYDTTDAMNGIKEMNGEELGAMFESLQKSVEMLILPLGEQLLPILSEVMQALMPMLEEVLPPLVETIGQLLIQMLPIIEEALPILIELFTSLVPPLMDLINAVLPVLIELFQQVLPPLIELMDAVLPILIELFETLIPPIVELIGAVLPILIALVDALLPIFRVLMELLAPVIELFMNLISPILELISLALVPLVAAITPIIAILAEELMPVIEMVGKLFTDIFGSILQTVTEVISSVVGVITGIIDFIKNVFTGNWEGAWQNIIDIFGSIIDGIVSVFKMPINLIIDGINFFIRGINNIKIPEWVPEIGGMGLSIKEIPKLRVGMEYVPEDDYLAYLHRGEAVLTAQENTLYRAAGGFEGVLRALSQPVDRTDTYVTVQNDGDFPEFDYQKMGETTAQALEHAGLSIRMDRRELGRVIREVKG